jgi:DNA polymerase III alpha subunit
MLVEFARRARGATPSPGVLSVLDELVPETYGVMTYQEQLQRVYQAITGCSGSEAEQFRTNVSKKLFEKVAQAYGPFIERAGAKIGTENAQKLWDFIKTWAEYGFNKSHAVCYALIGYSCAWLKHHYPLEWWCSVLRNATKDEVNEKFWRYCGKHVSLPDIKLSQENWAIEQDRIRAPVSLLHGIGEKAHEQLCRSAPYATIDDFAEKLLQHRADGIRQVMKSKTNPKTKEKTEVPGWSLGRSSISRSAVYTLIVAGAMDSLFPQNAGVAECLEMYDEAIKTAATKRWEQETHPEKKAMWKSAWTSYRNAAKKTYQTLDPLARYQMRKSILPAYGSDLRAMFLYLPLPSCLSIVDGKKMRYSWKRWDRDARRMVDAEDPVIGAEKLDILNTTQNLPTHGYRCAVLAYLEEKRRFQYGDHKSKEAMELTLEVGGGKYRFVVWPKSDGSLPDNIKELKNGSVIAAILVRNRPDKPFSVKDLTVVRDALKANTAGETKENENEEET